MQKNRMSSMLIGYLSLVPLVFAFLSVWGVRSFLKVSFPQALGLGIVVALVGKLVIFFRVLRKLRS